MAEEFDVDDLTDVVNELATGLYAITRPGPTTYTNGRRNAPSSTTFEVRGVVYPISGRALDRLPEGLRTHEAIALVTQTELRTASATGEADLVTYAGTSYQVQAVDRWRPSGNFYRAVATRVSSQ